MFKYYFNRGLDAVDILAQNFKSRTWFVPDLICDEVLDALKKYDIRIEFYHINDDFTWSVTVNVRDSKIFYSIDYFGKETNLGKEAPPNTIVIRDSVWFPYPFTAVEHNQVWFNSLRKIIRNAKGSSLISPYRISGINEVPNISYHPSLTWLEMNRRFENFYWCKEIFHKYPIPEHNQQFRSVFPIRLKDRDKVLENLDTPLQGMWKNRNNLQNILYKELTFIPIDSRFNKESLTGLACKIKELENGKTLSKTSGV